MQGLVDSARHRLVWANLQPGYAWRDPIVRRQLHLYTQGRSTHCHLSLQGSNPNGFRPPTSSTLQKRSFVIRLILNTLNVDQSFVSVLFTVTLLPDPYRNSQHHLKQWSCAGKPAQGVSDSHMQRQTSDPCSPSQQHAAEVRTPWNSLVHCMGHAGS